MKDHLHPADGPTLAGLFGDICRNPVRYFIQRWNWKSAVLSSLFRSAIFFLANLDAGFAAARAAFITELAFRGATAGFYGALTQAFRDVRPVWTGTMAGMLVLPAVAHGIEFCVHYMRGTARLGESIAWSVAFTALSTSFNLYAMRRGALTVGDGSQPLLNDLAAVPRLLAGFTRSVARSIFRFA